MFNKIEKQKGFFPAGFTLIEVTMVIAIISILTAISFISWQSFSDQTNLGNTAKLIESKIKLAKNYSLSAVNDANYGIRFDTVNNKITLFNANPYTAVEDYTFPAGVEIYNIGLGGAGGGASCDNDGVISGDEIGIDCGGTTCDPCSQDMIFSRLTGTTSNFGTFGIRVFARPTKTKTVTINSQGQTGTEVFGTSTIQPITEGFLNDGVTAMNSRHLHFNLAGWTIQGNPPITDLIFRKADGTLVQDISTMSYFNAGIFNWEGAITVDGVAQELRIHTLDINGNVLCIMRDRMENSKTLKISFIQSTVEKLIVTYTENADGTVTVAPNTPVYVSSMSVQ